MRKDIRGGKIFIDWSQNTRHKTTIAPYSLRARPHPTVSTPVSWDEVDACANGKAPLVFEAADVLATRGGARRSVRTRARAEAEAADALLVDDHA